LKLFCWFLKDSFERLTKRRREEIRQDKFSAKKGNNLIEIVIELQHNYKLFHFLEESN